MAVTLGKLAEAFGAELRGDPELTVERVGTLAGADGRTLAFLANPKYRPQLAGTRAGAVVLDRGSAASCPCAALVSRNPYALYARIAQVLHPRPAPVPGVHPSAIVAAGARVDPTAQVGPLAVIGEGVSIGARCVVGPHCVIEDGVVLGPDVYLAARVTLCRGVRVGARTILQPGVVLGGDGFGFAPEFTRDGGGAWVKIPQVGGVLIGADVEIGANTTIDRGAIEDTVIADDVKLDNLIQIGHNVRIGEHTAIAGCTGISGSTVIGKRCQIGGAVGMGGHLTITDDVIITGYSMISHSIMQPGVYSSGIPFEEARAWRRLVGHFKRIPQLTERVSRLERASGAGGAQQEAEEADD
jgi:UDP-3-O-[3-hydroxymyristoyl] glucosamine N-acyltransferase